MVVKVETWDPFEVPPIACHKSETVVHSRGSNEEIWVTDQEAFPAEVAANTGKALHDRACQR
jgi:hypothetical protein